LGQQARRDPDGNQLLGLPGGRAANAPRSAKLLIGGFGNVRKIQTAIRRRLDPLSLLPNDSLEMLGLQREQGS